LKNGTRVHETYAGGTADQTRTQTPDRVQEIDRDELPLIEAPDR